MPFKANAARRHHIPKLRHRVTNSAAYDAAVRQRGSLTVCFTDAAIAAWKAERRTTRGGQPRYSALAIATALTLRSVFRLALRQTEGLIGSIIALLGLDLAAPDHTTLSRRAETLDMVCPRQGSGPVHLLVDSTGLKLCGSGEWLLEKHGTKTRRDWRKLHIAVDAGTGRIATATVTTNDIDDASQVGPLLDQVDGPVESFTADGAYDQDGVCVGRSADAPLAEPLRLKPVPPAEPVLALLVDRARAVNPTLGASNAAIEAARTRSTLADKAGYPDVTVGAGPLFQTNNRPVGFSALVGLNIPLPWGRTGSGQPEAAAQLGATQQRYDAARLEIEGPWLLRSGQVL